ncbi:hypothetical protein K1719_002315 [Acacia pycnantha]|nr:hypothetical protein K1719_002315 [Acacia pycnantha]
MERMWAAKGPLRVTPLSNGYFLVSFSSTEDRDHALQEGPWMIADHYVLVQRWRPNFNPWKVDHQKRVAVWVRIPDLPHELYNVESIRRIGNMIRKTLKIDRTTAFSEKGGFARMCVEVDLQKPLLPGFSHFCEERRFKYEGLHLVCFTCGRYGHRMDQCTVTTQSKEPGNSSSKAPSVATTAPENPPVEGKGSNPALAKNKAGKGVEGVNAPNNVGDLADQKGVLNGKKAGDVEAGLCNFGIVIQNRNEKQEWVKVGAKRKDSNMREIIVEKKDCGLPIFNANKDGKDLSNNGGSGGARMEENNQYPSQDINMQSDDATMSSEDNQGDGLPMQNTSSQ